LEQDQTVERSTALGCIPAQVKLQIGANAKAFPRRQVEPLSIPVYLKAVQKAVQLCHVVEEEVFEGPVKSCCTVLVKPLLRLVETDGLMLRKCPRYTEPETEFTLGVYTPS